VTDAPITDRKSQAALANLERARDANAKRWVFDTWRCARCGGERPATVHQRRQTYCSTECMAQAYSDRMSGQSNPNFKGAGWRTCEHCGTEFHNYSKTRRFCSLACRDRGSFHLRTNAKKDANHDLIVGVLTKGGAFVRDLSRAMFGVPDLLVWHRNAWHLIEVKNPKTSYGRRGLNKAQAAWANEWSGGPVYVIRTVDDAAEFLAGSLVALNAEALAAIGVGA
jgi:hypothetical protein